MRQACIDWINDMLTLILVVLCIAMVLTLGPELSTALLMSAFIARRSFQSAAWVYVHDPLPVRGKVCAVFHVSVGIWLGAPSALLTIGGLFIANKHFQIPLDLDRANRALISLFSAIGISAILGAVASLVALRQQVRVWVNPHFCRALAEELAGRHIRSNYGLFVTATSISIPALAVLAVVLRNELPPAVGMAVLPVTLLVVLIPLFWLSSRIFATSPVAYLRPRITCQTPEDHEE